MAARGAPLAEGSGRSGLRDRPAPLRVPQRPPLPSRSPPAAPRPAAEPLGWSPPHGGAPSFVCRVGLTGCEGQVPAGGRLRLSQRDGFWAQKGGFSARGSLAGCHSVGSFGCQWKSGFVMSELLLVANALSGLA